MLIATSTAAAERAYLAECALVRDGGPASPKRLGRDGGPTMKFGAPVPSNTAIDSIDQENFKAW
jgi:hypothetical protein